MNKQCTAYLQKMEQGKTALVTGSGKRTGIGYAIVRSLVSSGLKEKREQTNGGKNVAPWPQREATPDMKAVSD